MGWYDRGRARVFKEPVSAIESEELPRLAANEVSDIFLCHVRKGTGAAVSYRNCHPFQFENWLFAHNGRVEESGRLRGLLSERHRGAIQGETDSEVYFHWILQNIERCEGDVVAGLRVALQSIGDYTGLNFVLSDGERLYAFRDARAEQDYYSLHYLERAAEPVGLAGPEDLRSKEVGSLFRSKRLRGEKAVLVCSEPLTEGEWKPMELGYLLVVGPKVEPHLVAVR